MNSVTEWNSFQKLLSEVSYRTLTEGATTPIYHYTNVDADSLELDPTYKKQSYSSRDFETASTPRTFFYTNPSQKERFFTSSKLYKTEVPSGQIYNLTSDPDGYVAKHRHPVYGLRKGEDWDAMLEDIRDSFGGIFYSLPNFDVVAWFHPILVNRVSDEEKEQVEKRGN